jgi:hypothetical protein
MAAARSRQRSVTNLSIVKAEAGASRVEYSQAEHRWMSRMVTRRELPDGFFQTIFVLCFAWAKPNSTQ